MSERAWGTVREDYSAGGDAWEYFPHDHARSRAYRWNEDGLAGISDRHQRICFALALWNGRDPILKERLFGLTGPRGNHGEDVKEYYFYLDSTPTHSYMKWLYKYPQAAFPYERLVEENRRRGRDEPEFELLDTGVFDEDRYFDVFVEYAKAIPRTSSSRSPSANRGPEPAPLHVLPTVWFRNTWSWDADGAAPGLRCRRRRAPTPAIALDDPVLRSPVAGRARTRRTCSSPRTRPTPRVCSACRRAAVRRRTASTTASSRATHDAVNPARDGHEGGGALPTCGRPGRDGARPTATDRRARRPFGRGAVRRRVRQDLAHARREADEFYAQVIPAARTDDAARVMRQAFAGLLWSKQFYHYVVRDWLDGDPGLPAAARANARAAATTSGRTSTTPTSSRCPTSGSTRGTPPGIWPSTACRSPSWMPSSRRSSSC